MPSEPVKPPKANPTPLRKFDALFRAVISVPKSAVDREEAKLKRRKKRRAEKPA